MPWVNRVSRTGRIANRDDSGAGGALCVSVCAAALLFLPVHTVPCAEPPQVRVMANVAYGNETPDDPPAFVMGAWRENLAVLGDPPVPPVINDPHSAWHGVLLAEAMRKAGVQVEVRIGPEVGRDRKADTAVLVAFLRQWLLPQSECPRMSK